MAVPLRIPEVIQCKLFREEVPLVMVVVVETEKIPVAPVMVPVKNLSPSKVEVITIKHVELVAETKPFPVTSVTVPEN